jgi:sugar/nucleoside kinase (ribokinase family)
VTSVAPDFPFFATLENRLISIVTAASASTTVFRNSYQNGLREQFVKSVAAPIRATDVPETWTSAAIAYICPIANEVAPDIPDRFRSYMLGIGAQGWFRKWDSTGQVRRKKWTNAAEVTRHADAVIYSELDTDEPYALAEDIAGHTPIVVVTQASRGANLFLSSRRVHVPAFPIEEIDPTGAGDAFAAAFLVRHQECGDPVEAAKFACCAASFVCEKEGTEGIPALEQVLERKKKYDDMYE